MAGILGDEYLDAIRRFEGFTPKAAWDYAQYSNGYGTKAQYPGEVISRDVAEERLQKELGQAAALVDAKFPDLPEGPRAALTSLTYNAGPRWMSGPLGNAVGSGQWETAARIFNNYNTAGGQTLPGLTARRQEESQWLLGNMSPMAASGSPPGLPVQAGERPIPAQAPASFPSAVAQPMRRDDMNVSGDLQRLAMSYLNPSLPQVPPMQFAPLRPPMAQAPFGLRRII